MKTNRRHFINDCILSSVALGMASMPLCTVRPEIHSKGVKKSNLTVFGEVDICVVGGSCTGVFAAVRAARLGAKVAIIEEQGSFGGNATNGMVNVWHSLLDVEFKKKIIGGLTDEVIERLKKRDAVEILERSEAAYTFLNSQELKIELDELITESKVKPYLHVLFSEPYWEKGRLRGVIVDGKSGRGIIKAKYFVDASGDGDLCVRMGLKSYTYDNLQPPTTCGTFEGMDVTSLTKLIKEHGKEINIPDGFIWDSPVPSTSSRMLAGTRVYGKDCCKMNDLTEAEIEGRRQIRAIMDLQRKYGLHPIGLNGLSSYIGIRETRHIKAMYQVTDHDALYGRKFDDTIANGSYRFDMHLQDKPGIIFRYMNGTEIYDRPGYPEVKSRWRPVTAENPTYYQIPLCSIIPQDTENVIMAGRMFDAEQFAFSGMRVMVNMNQVGEAAGVISYLALAKNCQIKDVPAVEAQETLRKGGSILF